MKVILFAIGRCWSDFVPYKWRLNNQLGSSIFVIFEFVRTRVSSSSNCLIRLIPQKHRNFMSLYYIVLFQRGCFANSYLLHDSRVAAACAAISNSTLWPLHPSGLVHQRIHGSLAFLYSFWLPSNIYNSTGQKSKPVK